MIGEVPSGLPPLGLPFIPRDDIGAVAVGGMSLGLVALAEGLAASRLFATRGGYRVETDRELVGMGAANVAAGLSGGLAVAGSLSKSAAADQAGSGSQITGMAASVITMIVLLAFTWVFTDLPQAVLSAIVVAAVWSLIDVPALLRYSPGPPGRLLRRCGRRGRRRAVRTITRPRHRHCGVAAGDRLPVVATTHGGARQDRSREGCLGQAARPS